MLKIYDARFLLEGNIFQLTTYDWDLLDLVIKAGQEWSISKIETFQEMFQLEMFRENLNFQFSIVLLGFRTDIFFSTDRFEDVQEEGRLVEILKWLRLPRAISLAG